MAGRTETTMRVGAGTRGGPPRLVAEDDVPRELVSFPDRWAPTSGIGGGVFVLSYEGETAHVGQGGELNATTTSGRGGYLPRKSAVGGNEEKADSGEGRVATTT